MECLRVASQHNKITHAVRPESFKDKVYLARRLLYTTYNKEEGDEIPSEGRRDGLRTKWKQSFGIAMDEKKLTDKVKNHHCFY